MRITRRVLVAGTCYWVWVVCLAALVCRFGYVSLTQPRIASVVLLAASALGLVAALLLRFGPGRFHSSASIRKRLETGAMYRDG